MGQIYLVDLTARFDNGLKVNLRPIPVICNLSMTDWGDWKAIATEKIKGVRLD